jgi:hypothetical protein
MYPKFIIFIFLLNDIMYLMYHLNIMKYHLLFLLHILNPSFIFQNLIIRSILTIYLTKFHYKVFFINYLLIYYNMFHK